MKRTKLTGLKDVHLGTKVYRYMCGDFSTTPQELTVTGLMKDSVLAGHGPNACEFHKKTGGEIDDDLGFDGIKITGSIALDKRAEEVK